MILMLSYFEGMLTEEEMKQKKFQPRNMVSKEVAGICGVARMADKARAAHTGQIREYKYGADSQQDTRILTFLGITPDAFQEAAVRNTNDVRLGAWVLDHCKRSDEDISKFNQQLLSWWKTNTPRNYFSKRRRQLAREQPDLSLTFWDWLFICLFG